jgi:hypothetical protein
VYTVRSSANARALAARPSINSSTDTATSIFQFRFYLVGIGVSSNGAQFIALVRTP